MRLSTDMQALLSEHHAQRFDLQLLQILSARHAEFARLEQPRRLGWISEKRLWLARIGVRAQQHILDHLDIFLRHGFSVVDESDYRAIMARPFMSQEEKAVKLLRRYPPQEATGSHERS